MSELVADCPRCGATKITMDVMASNLFKIEYRWQHHYEIFCVCRDCQRSSILRVAERNTDVKQQVDRAGGLSNVKAALGHFVEVKGHISLKDEGTIDPPDHLPAAIRAVFVEGATCFAVGCHNAAGTMFRLCVDLVTKAMLPVEEIDGLNGRTRRDLGLRLPWLFDHNYLPEGLRDLSSCIKDDGNDGAHAGTLTSAEAADLLDFTAVLLERLYTEPAQLQLALERRQARKRNV